MSNAFAFGAVRHPGHATRKLVLSLLVIVPMLGLCLAHAVGTKSAVSVQDPEFGYAEWAAK